MIRDKKILIYILLLIVSLSSSNLSILAENVEISGYQEDILIESEVATNYQDFGLLDIYSFQGKIYLLFYQKTASPSNYENSEREIYAFLGEFYKDEIVNIKKLFPIYVTHDIFHYSFFNSSDTLFILQENEYNIVYYSVIPQFQKYVIPISGEPNIQFSYFPKTFVINDKIVSISNNDTLFVRNNHSLTSYNLHLLSNISEVGNMKFIQKLNLRNQFISLYDYNRSSSLLQIVMFDQELTFINQNEYDLSSFLVPTEFTKPSIRTIYQDGSNLLIIFRDGEKLKELRFNQSELSGEILFERNLVDLDRFFVRSVLMTSTHSYITYISAVGDGLSIALFDYNYITHTNDINIISKVHTWESQPLITNYENDILIITANYDSGKAYIKAYYNFPFRFGSYTISNPSLFSASIVLLVMVLVPVVISSSHYFMVKRRLNK